MFGHFWESLQRAVLIAKENLRGSTKAVLSLCGLFPFLVSVVPPSWCPVIVSQCTGHNDRGLIGYVHLSGYFNVRIFLGGVTWSKKTFRPKTH